MLVVSQVNECAYCSFLHARKALEEGVPPTAVNDLLNFDGGHFSRDELPAALFAQHFAESKGTPSEKSKQVLVEKYGACKAQEIQAFAQSVLFGNLCCNTVVSFKEQQVPRQKRNKLRLVYLFSIPIAGRIRKSSEKGMRKK